jgi:preprotein translocase subunit SecG
MITFLLVVHGFIALGLVVVILMQRSEGGGLGMGGGPAGLMTARGAADFLTRATSVLATLFVIMAFVIAAIASRRDSAAKIDTSLAHQAPAAPITAPTPAGSAIPGIPMMGATNPAATAPDAVTSQALQPAAAGLPGAAAAKVPSADELRAQAAAERTNAKALHRAAPTAANLKTIDTSKAAGNASIGINGLSSTPAHNAAAPTAPPIAPKTIPTLNIAPPPTPTGNGATPQ